MSDFENRFSFIKDAILRQNLTQIFEHVAELALVVNHEQVQKKELFRKTILLQTASIIEALLFYLIKEKGLWAEFGEKWIYKDPKKICSQEDEEIVWCRRKKVSLTKRTDFGEMIKICRRAGFFAESEFKKIDRVRELRNKIHLQTLTAVDRGVSLAQLEQVFMAARMTTNNIQKFLTRKSSLGS